MTPFSHPIIAGAGTMGVTLARLFAQNGYAVTLWNRKQDSLDRAVDRIAGDLADLETQGRLTEPVSAITGRIRYTTDWAVYKTADLVIENIAEDLAVKHGFYERLSSLVPETALLATNTSGLRVTDVARAVTHPGRFCGMHFWNPPDLIPLVEVTKGDLTDDAAAQAILALAESLGKKPVLVQKDILGIIGNRLQYAVLREALHILELGAVDAKGLDDAMKYGPGFRYSVLGPLETVDLGGLDIFRAVSNYLFPDLGTQQRSEVLNRLADAGRYGTKTGAGFYDYAPGEGEEKLRWRNDLFQKQWDLLRDNPFPGQK